MADLDNLLDDINNDDEINDAVDQQQQLAPDYEGEHGDDFGAERERVTASAAPDDGYGAGDEERDYRQGSAAQDPYGDEEGEGEDEGRNYNPDYEQLKHLWTSELACPELLYSDAETILQNVEELEKKEGIIEELLQRSKQQRGSREASGELASLVAQITRMDADRTRFMLVDLARTRMAKIENHALHNRTLVDRMTEEERAYLRQYGELLEKHHRRTVLNHLPKEAWKKLDEPEMIDSPDLEQFVFCRVNENIQIDVTGEKKVLDEDLQNEDEDFGDNVQEQVAGSYLIVMYKQVRELVLDGKVDLLM